MYILESSIELLLDYVSFLYENILYINLSQSKMLKFKLNPVHILLVSYLMSHSLMFT